MPPPTAPATPGPHAPDPAAPALADRSPRPSPQRLLDDLVPPPQFVAARFTTYRPDPDRPSQVAAVAALEDLAARTTSKGSGGGALSRLLGRRRAEDARPLGAYLDGGFGVGKTHLLVSLFEAVAERAGREACAYGTFVEYTNLAGALGFRQAVDALRGRTLVCIDEFELDDPGDTVLMARMLRELADAGVALAATSNTLPDALGEGRFAADDFLREIQAVGSRFEILHVDGEDYRHRGLPTPPEPPEEGAVAAAARAGGPGAVLDAFGPLLAHLGRVHPSRYGALLDGVGAVHWTGVREVTDVNVALRLVVLVDRMYDRDLPLLASGAPLDAVFGPAMLDSGYRKKYRRAISRLTAMARAGAERAGG